MLDYRSRPRECTDLELDLCSRVLTWAALLRNLIAD
jgi:hypothetical protein